jgi:hypothetical protein
MDNTNNIDNTNNMDNTIDNVNLIINCPHCHEIIIIEQMNCRIFRHGIFKNTLQQINPHSTKIECDNYVNLKLIFGCGKPFMIDNDNNVIICDYI